MNKQMRVIATYPDTKMSDHRRWPGSRLLISCCLCGWSKSYGIERVIDRLRELRTGNHMTRLEHVARRVAWPCPGCGRVKWRAQFAWPPDITESEIKRLANRYRN